MRNYHHSRKRVIKIFGLKDAELATHCGAQSNESINNRHITKNCKETKRTRFLYCINKMRSTIAMAKRFFSVSIHGSYESKSFQDLKVDLNKPSRLCRLSLLTGNPAARCLPLSF